MYCEFGNVDQSVSSFLESSKTTLGFSEIPHCKNLAFTGPIPYIPFTRETNSPCIVILQLAHLSCLLTRLALWQ